MNDIIKRPIISDIFIMKIKALNKIKEVEEITKELDSILEKYHRFKPYRIDWKYGNYDSNREEKYIDRICWYYLVSLFELKKYMLCTEYDKMNKEIESFQTPVFNIANAEAWLSQLKSLIYKNIKTMLKTVYDKIITDYYYTGSGYSNRKKKKRNNNGVDKNFILTTNDYNMVHGYYSYYGHITITDDLEKACYLLDGKTVPVKTIKETMRENKTSEAENKYFKIKVCKNGNTHYTIFEDTRNKLNLIGPDGNIIGEKIKIKLFDGI